MPAEREDGGALHPTAMRSATMRMPPWTRSSTYDGASSPAQRVKQVASLCQQPKDTSARLVHRGSPDGEATGGPTNHRTDPSDLRGRSPFEVCATASQATRSTIVPFGSSLYFLLKFSADSRRSAQSFSRSLSFPSAIANLHR